MWSRIWSHRLTLGVVTASASAAAGVVVAQSEAQLSMRQSPVAASRLLHDSEVYKNRPRMVISKEQMRTLASTGLLICDDVAGASELADARVDIGRLLAGQRSFQPNGLQDADVRSDSVMWISESLLHESIINADYLPDSLKLLLRVVRSVPQELQQAGCPGQLGVPLTIQLACYDGGGAKYIAHRDNPDDGGGAAGLGFLGHVRRVFLSQHAMTEREYTIILYINEPDWGHDDSEKDRGGYLRCYPNADASDDVGSSGDAVDIAPRGGRLVIFDSKRILHEVLPSPRRRLALTCWCGGPYSPPGEASLLQLLSSASEEFDGPKMRASAVKRVLAMLPWR